MKSDANQVVHFTKTSCMMLLATLAASCETADIAPPPQPQRKETTFCVEYVNTSSKNVVFSAKDANGKVLPNSEVTMPPARDNPSVQAIHVLLTGTPPIQFSLGPGATHVLGDKDCTDNLNNTPSGGSAVEIIRAEATDQGLQCKSEGTSNCP